jgi:predicted dehydrogenase
MKHAIIGTGGMAHQHARKFKEIEGVELVAACDIDESRVKGFCAVHGIAQAFTETPEMLAVTDIDSVSVVTPDRFHAPVSLQAIAARKHVLCEKPLALNHNEALDMAREAEKAGIINMVNFSYRDSSAIQMATEWLQAGKIGTIRHVEACYHQSWLTSKAWGDWKDSPGLLWRLSEKHGSKGTLGDIGVHILDFATLPVGPIRQLYCTLHTLPKPGGDRIGEYIFDANDTVMMNLVFANGATGSITSTR